MKALVVYDLAYGNTEQIARTILSALASQVEAELLQVGDVNALQDTGVKWLVVGSPTQKFKPTPAIQSLLASIPPHGLKGVKVTAFDTRFTPSVIEKTPVLAFFVKIFGYAAQSIAGKLVKKGGTLIVPPEGFFVEDTEGPLQAGELERAASWALKLLNPGKSDPARLDTQE